MMRTLSTRRLITEGESGQSLVEAAFALGVFLVLLMGIVDLGLGVFYFNVLSNAAREGARTGITLSSSNTPIASDICEATVNKAWLPSVSLSDCTSGVTPPASTSPSRCQPAATADLRVATAGLEVWVSRGTRGGQVQVWVAYPFVPLTTNLLFGANPSPLWLCAASSMYVEN